MLTSHSLAAHSIAKTLIVLLAIPSSLLVALIAMFVAGLTLNGMTLIALTTAFGKLTPVLESWNPHDR